MEPSMIHLPAVLANEFGIRRSEARRYIALGRVKLNGHVTTDIDVPQPDKLSTLELLSYPFG